MMQPLYQGRARQRATATAPRLVRLWLDCNPSLQLPVFPFRPFTAFPLSLRKLRFFFSLDERTLNG